jgi:hypothetical protein
MGDYVRKIQVESNQHWFPYQFCSVHVRTDGHQVRKEFLRRDAE